MANPALGVKQLCESCGARFFDMNKNPATCPKCNAVVGAKPKDATPVEEDSVPEDDVVNALEIDLDEDLDLVEDDDDDSLLADASVLSDDDDINGVMENLDDDDLDKV